MSTASVSLDDILRVSGLTTLGEAPAMEAIEASLRALANHYHEADALRRETLRQGAVCALEAAGVRAPARLVDAAFSRRGGMRDDGLQGQAIVLTTPEPWPDVVDGAELLKELADVYARYVAQPPEAATAEALWTLHAHAHDAASVSPPLGITSPTKRSGKTTLLTVMGCLVPRPLPAGNITASALFRAVEEYRPTLLVDEADTFLRDRDDLRGVLNTGHTRSGARVVRTVGERHEARTFSTWCPKAIALIGNLPDTLWDRSVVVRLQRRRPDELVRPLRLDRLEEFEPLRRRCVRWAADHMDTLAAADPDVPGSLHDRAADNWRALLAIADLAGGPWPALARQAALRLSGPVEDDGDAGVLLLADLRSLYKNGSVERIASQEITKALGRMEDRPWPEWRKGNPITTRQLAGLLKRFGISPRQLKSDGDKIRGYDRADLAAVWARYVPAEGRFPSGTPVPGDNGAGFRGLPSGPGGTSSTGSRPADGPTAGPMVPEYRVEPPASAHSPPDWGRYCEDCRTPVGPTAERCARCRYGGSL